MARAGTGRLDADTVVHRIGGADIANLRLRSKEEILMPPGISVLLGGSVRDVEEQVRLAFPHATRLLEAARRIATTTVGAVRRAGFDVIADTTRHFPNHARLIHPDGINGFTEPNLSTRASAFTRVTRS